MINLLHEKNVTIITLLLLFVIIYYHLPFIIITYYHSSLITTITIIYDSLQLITNDCLYLHSIAIIYNPLRSYYHLRLLIKLLKNKEPS